MKVSNLKVYDMEDAIRASGYPMKEFLNIREQHRYIDEHDFKRACALAARDSSEGHDNFLAGIVVSFDLTCTIKMWTEFERYHFAQIVSSQSTMHRLSKMHIDTACNPYVDQRIIQVLNQLQELYAERGDKNNLLSLLYSCPVGLNLTARVTTNYRQLKTIIKQRHNHRLPEWQEFCAEIMRQCPHALVFLKPRKEEKVVTNT